MLFESLKFENWFFMPQKVVKFSSKSEIGLEFFLRLIFCNRSLTLKKKRHSERTLQCVGLAIVRSEGSKPIAALNFVFFKITRATSYIKVGGGQAKLLCRKKWGPLPPVPQSVGLGR